MNFAAHTQKDCHAAAQHRTNARFGNGLDKCQIPGNNTMTVPGSTGCTPGWAALSNVPVPAEIRII
jgi:hypothetical protein